MQKPVKKATAAKSTKSSVSTKNGTKNRTTYRNAAGKKLYAVKDAKGRFVDIQTYEQVVAERATASEIRKALGIKRENTERIRQVIRDLEAKNWQMD